MIVNPGIRRFLGSAIQRLFNSASVSLPLTHTAIPTRGDITPSFTRATTATGQKWDEAGYLDFTALAGEAVFKGARRVRNLLTFTEDFSNAAWTKSVCSVTSSTESGPLGSTNATLITLGGGTTNKAIVYSATASAPAIPSFYFKAGTHKYIQLMNASDGEVFANFDLELGVVGTKGTKATSAIEDVGDGWYRVSALYNSTAILGTSWRVYFVSSASAVYAAATASTGTVYIWGAQLEDVTGQTTQTASEYVSVGVESAPAYHGSMVDGVKCYDTDRSGNPISTSGSYPLVGYVPWEARTNLCIRSQEFDTWSIAAVGAGSVPVVTANQGVAPDGTTTADKVVFVAPVAGDVSQVYSPIFATVAASSYTAAVHVKAFAAGDVGKQLLIRHVGGTAYTTITLTAAWQRLGCTEVAAAATAEFDILLRPTFGGSSGTVSCYLWQADVQLGTFITPAIPTTTIAVARNADVDQYPTTDGPIAAAGSISLDFTPYHAPSGTIALWGTYVDASNYTAILHDATNLIFRKRIAGSNYDATIANAFVSGTTYKVAATWGAAGTAIYLDGVAGTPHANTTAAQIAATMQVGADGNSLQQPGAGTTNLRIWQRQLSAPEGVAVTS